MLGPSCDRFDQVREHEAQDLRALPEKGEGEGSENAGEEAEKGGGDGEEEGDAGEEVDEEAAPDVGNASAEVGDEAAEQSEVADPEAEERIEAHEDEGDGERLEAEGKEEAEEKSPNDAEVIEVPDAVEDPHSTCLGVAAIVVSALDVRIAAFWNRRVWGKPESRDLNGYV